MENIVGGSKGEKKSLIATHGQQQTGVHTNIGRTKMAQKDKTHQYLLGPET